MIWLCIISLLPMNLAASDQTINTSHIRVFPAANHSIAGVFLVSYTNAINQTQYAFNASEAREVCWSLGLNIASKAQVEEALTLGLETCRFGWIDEHFVVIPRVKASKYCGRNRTGLVEWRVPVTRKFDVFCFNESDTVTQLKDTAADSPLAPGGYPENTPFPSEAATSTSNPQPTFTTPLVEATHSALSTSPSLSTLLSYSSPDSTDTEAEPPQFISSAHGSIGVPVKALLITSACVLVLTAIAILAYMKLNKICFLSWDVKQQQGHIEAEEWTCVKNIKDPQKHAQEEVRIEMCNNTRETLP